MSTPSERAVTVNRPLVPSFRRVEVSVVRVWIRLGESSEGITLRGEARVLEQIRSEVVGGCLYLGPAPNASFSTEVPVEIEFATSALEAVSCAAGAQVLLQGAAGGVLQAAAASGARLRVEGEMDQVWAMAESGGTVDLSGLSCRNVSAQSASGGRVI